MHTNATLLASGRQPVTFGGWSRGGAPNGCRGGAPGGAGPYVTGAAHPGWRARWHARAARAGPFAKELPREPRKLPWGLANPWRLPALDHLASAREAKGDGRTRRPKTKNTGRGALAA